MGLPAGLAGVAWYQLFGLAHLALALGLVVVAGWQVATHLDRPGSARTLWSGALLGFTAAFQVVLAAMWYTGTGIDLDRFESGPIFG